MFYENGQSNTLKPEKIRSAFGVPSIRFTVNGKETGSGSQSGSGGLSVSGGGALAANHLRRRDCLPGIR